MDRRKWRWATAWLHGRQRSHVLGTIAVVLVVIVLFVLCVWGP